MAKQSSSGDNLTESEGYINFQIKLKKKEIEALQESINELEKKKQTYTEMREQLSRDQGGRITALRKKAKEQETRVVHTETVNRQQAERALKHNVDTACARTAELEGLCSQLSHMERQVLDLKADHQVWLQYKNTGSPEHQAQIAHLQEQSTCMQRTHETDADIIKRSKEDTLKQLDQETARAIDEKTQLAIERAIAQLDRFCKQELKENEWLKSEVASWQRQVSSMELSVQSLEKENLEHVTWLFDQRLEDLNISREAFLTQPARLDSSDTQSQARSVKGLTLGGDVAGAVACLDGGEADGSCSGQLTDKDELHLGPEGKLLCVVGQVVSLQPLKPSDGEVDTQTRATPE